MGTAGIVLAGGRSSRMGTDKASLAWNGSTLLGHTCAVLGAAGLDPVLVVRAAGQALPLLPPDVAVVDDPREGLGPVQGIAAGLRAVADRASSAFVAATDLPFLCPEFVATVVRVMDSADVDVCLPVVRGRAQPMTAAYRTSLAPLVLELVEAGRLRPAELFERVRVLRLDAEALLADPALRAADPELESLVNLNWAADYAAATQRVPDPSRTR